MPTKILLTSALALAGLLATPAMAGTVTLSVPGSANPFLAGQPDGVGFDGDITPDQSPTLVPGVLTAGATLTFSALGGFAYNGGPGTESADGDTDGINYQLLYNMSNDNGTGISGPLGVNVDGLVGVFIGSDVPGGPAPDQLDYSILGLEATSYSPGLNQIFWIGDGLAGIGSGATQSFIVPLGATRLFLGSVDGGGWFNNEGLSSVTISGLTDPVTPSVPEPASWAMMIGGFALAGRALRRRTTAVRLALA